MAKTYAELTQRRQALVAEGRGIAKKDAPAEGDAARIAAIEAELEQIEADRSALFEQISAAAAGEPGRIAAAVDTERKRVADIAAACDLAGRPAAAHGFIKDGKSVEDAVAALKAERQAGNDELNPRRSTGAGAPDSKAAWDKAIGKVNARQARSAA